MAQPLDRETIAKKAFYGLSPLVCMAIKDSINPEWRTEGIGFDLGQAVYEVNRLPESVLRVLVSADEVRKL